MIRRWAGLFVLLGSGCTLINFAEPDPTLVDASVARDAAATPDAGAPDSSLGDAGTPGSCGRRPPGVPDGTDEADDERIFGLRGIELDQRSENAWAEIGLDLDGFCTDAVGAGECVPEDTRSTPPIDGNDGIDNVFGSSLVELLDLRVNGWGAPTRAAQESGRVPVIRVRGWNELDDDPTVISPARPTCSWTPMKPAACCPATR